MPCYVDRLNEHGWYLGPSCHLIADTLDELHELATRVGMKRAWFQSGVNPHYDLTAKRRARAVELGAVELDRRAFVGKLRAIRTSASPPRHPEASAQGQLSKSVQTGPGCGGGSTH